MDADDVQATPLPPVGGWLSQLVLLRCSRVSDWHSVGVDVGSCRSKTRKAPTAQGIVRAFSLVTADENIILIFIFPIIWGIVTLVDCPSLPFICFHKQSELTVDQLKDNDVRDLVNRAELVLVDFS